MNLKKCLFTTLAFTGLSFSSFAESEQKSFHITIYQNNLGLIEDNRSVDIEGGKQNITIEGVSNQMIQDSLILLGKNYEVLTRRFDFDVTTPRKLLEGSIGKKVRFRKNNPATGIDEIIEATILSTQGNGIIERDGQIEVGYPGTLILDQKPENFLVKPSLNLVVNSNNASKAPLTLGYLSKGLSWKTAYVLDAKNDGSEIELRTWANLTNNTGVDFENANLMLGAGKINQRSRPDRKMMSAAPAMARTMSMDMVQESVAAAPPSATSNIYTYPLKEPYNLKNGQTLQVALMPLQKIKSKRSLVQRFGPVYGDMRHQGNQPLYPNVELKFENTTKLPLPNGIARVYGKNDQGNRLFLGEDTLRQTPNGEEVSLNTGQSFDVSIRRKQSNFQLNGLPKNTYRAAYKVTIKNAGKVSESLRLEENFPGDWKLRASNIKPSESTARQMKWEMDIEPNKSIELTYEVEVRTR